MNARNAIYAALVIIVLVGILLLRSSVQIVPENRVTTLLQPNDIRGMEIVYKNLPYTLNFDQQQEMLELINRCIPVGKISASPGGLPYFKKIVVYLFGRPSIELNQVDFAENEFYFQAPGLNADGFLMDVSGGRMFQLVESAHD
ncbi:MAG: hypothetical protein Q8K75_10000 [Chlamydiales bacterium]|nr:hypothetical protein [Chlamydiales bacterium]